MKTVKSPDSHRAEMCDRAECNPNHANCTHGSFSAISLYYAHSKNLLAGPSRTGMNISNLNRTVLAVVLGSVLAGGMTGPANAQAWRQRHSAQEPQSSSTATATATQD